MINMLLEDEGIRLTYGMSIDYFSAPGMEQYVDQRGRYAYYCAAGRDI